MILTKRLEIHPMKVEEWRDLQEIFSDFEDSPEAIYDYPLPTDEKKVREQARVWSESGYFYSVCLQGSTEVIGYLCFCGAEIREMGYSFKKRYQRQGYAFEAAQAMLEVMRKEFGVTEVRAELALGNKASLGLIQKLGFSQVGIRNHLFRKERGKEERCGIFRKRFMA